MCVVHGYHDSGYVSHGDAKKVKAFNLMLTSPHTVVRTLAERYLDGVENIDAFLDLLKKLPPNLTREMP